MVGVAHPPQVHEVERPGRGRSGVLEAARRAPSSGASTRRPATTASAAVRWCLARLPSATGGVLLALSGLHLAWGFGSTAPFSDPEDLSDAVLGRLPSGDSFVDPTACFAVAGALATAASLVTDRPAWPAPLRQLGLAVLTTTLVVRGAFGLAGRTDVLVPGSTSPRFRRNDRRLFAPLCLTLAAGSVRAARR